MTEKELLERVADAQRSNPTLKEQLDEYRARRRAYEEMQRGGQHAHENVAREQRTERRYTV